MRPVITDARGADWELLPGTEWCMQAIGAGRGPEIVLFFWEVEERYGPATNLRGDHEMPDIDVLRVAADEWRRGHFCGAWGHVTPHRACILRDRAASKPQP